MKKTVLIFVLVCVVLSSFVACGLDDRSKVKDSESSTVSVTGISLNLDKISLTVGSDFELIATVKPKNATNKEVVFDSSDKTVATVDENGKVVAVSVGNAVITAKTKDDKFSAKCEITVKAKEENELPDVKV